MKKDFKLKIHLLKKQEQPIQDLLSFNFYCIVMECGKICKDGRETWLLLGNLKRKSLLYICKKSQLYKEKKDSLSRYFEAMKVMFDVKNLSFFVEYSVRNIKFQTFIFKERLFFFRCEN